MSLIISSIIFLFYKVKFSKYWFSQLICYPSPLLSLGFSINTFNKILDRPWTSLNILKWLLSVPKQSILGERNGNPLQHSCLENPMDCGAWQDPQSMGLQRVGHQTEATLHTHTQTKHSNSYIQGRLWRAGTYWSPVAKTLCFHCSLRGFDPWPRK